MRVAVVFYGAGRSDQLKDLARALARGIERQGVQVQVDLLDVAVDREKKLTLYDYLVVGMVSETLFRPKVPGALKEFLARAGQIAGKRAFAFVPKRMFAAKALLKLMAAMEHEGLYLKNSAVISSPAEAEYLGEHLHLSTRPREE